MKFHSVSFSMWLGQPNPIMEMMKNEVSIRMHCLQVSPF